MLILDAQPETLKLSFERDPVTHLPLLHEADDLLSLTLNYLPLPHSVVEFGCGKKASLILHLLTQHGVPVYGLKRGMILERDMSRVALDENDASRRPHALLVKNPLYGRADLNDDSLRGMLENASFKVRPEESIIEAGQFELNHVETVQFAVARSHIYTVVTFWDPDANRAVDRVVDPTLDREKLFPVSKMREYLRASQALIFTAPMLGRFRLDPAQATTEQLEEIGSLLKTDDPKEKLEELDTGQHADLIRRLTGAPAGSIGDPETWSYANNIRPSDDPQHDDHQTHNTGLGDPIRGRLRELLRNRSSSTKAELEEQRKALSEATIELEVVRRLKRDAMWSGKELDPLARLAAVISAHISLRDLSECIREGGEWPCDPESAGHLERMHGIGIRLRERIERLALASTDSEGKISACAFSPEFNEAAAETIGQMNQAGLTVFIDRVGNLHGIRLSDSQVEDLREGRKTLRDFTAYAICHGSHIDTVEDAGKHDGRLGVVAGIEVARVIDDLQKFFEISLDHPPTAGALMVTAFMGEEMTYSGNHIAMPGSAAISGRAKVEDVHAMTDAEDHRFDNDLAGMLRFLRAQREKGKIDFWNDFPENADDRALFEACPHPTEFFTPHTYERHIEQGPELDRAGVPLVLVERIMGIHQEDFFFEGPAAEEAALELDIELRELALEARFQGVRITIGVLESQGETCSHDHATAWRWRLCGEKNHAGSTATRDRRDAGTAAARLVRELHKRADNDFTPLAGEVKLIPGTNRNVIPGEALVTLGTEEELSGEEKEALFNKLSTFVTETLAEEVGGRGEGVFTCEVKEKEKVTTATRMRLSIDLRAAEKETIETFRREIDGLLTELSSRFNVDVETQVQQEVLPLSLNSSGQVLQLERSYGGSHNPNEAELASDLLRGTLLQLSVTRRFRQCPTPQGVNLYKLASELVPSRWKQRLAHFVSGALHDTCNIAASVQENRDPSAQY